MGNLFYKNANGSIYYNSGNIGIGNAAPTTKLDVSGTIKATGFSMDGHIIPTINDTYDIGSADYKIRDLYVSDNSLWIGDIHKVSISNGKLKFRKRKINVIPSTIATHNSNSTDALMHAGVANLTDMKLQHWHNYMKTFNPLAKMTDIFRDNSDDYEEESDAFSWLKTASDKIYYNTAYVGIGTDNPSRKLEIQQDTDGSYYQLRLSNTGGVAGLEIKDNSSYITTLSSHSGNFSLINTGLTMTIQNVITGSSGDIQFVHSDTQSYTRLMLKYNGNIGINLTNPTFKFEVRTGAEWGIMHTDGTREVGSYLDTSYGYYGTKTNTPFKLVTNGVIVNLDLHTNGNVYIPYNLTLGSNNISSGQLKMQNLYGGYGDSSENFHIDNHTNAGNMFLNYINERPVRLFNSGSTGNFAVYTQQIDPIYVSCNTNPTIGWISRIRLNNSVSNQDVFMGHHTNIHGTCTGIFSHHSSMSTWNHLYVNCTKNDSNYIACLGEVSVMDSAWIGCDINSGNSSQGNSRILTIGRSFSYQYGIKFGGWTGSAEYGNAIFQMSHNLHIDSPNSGVNGLGHIYMNYYNSGANIYLRSTAYFSDKRLKKDFQSINDDEVLNLCENINITKYKYKDEIRNPLSDGIYGFIAQDVKKYYPQAINITKGNNPHIMEVVTFSINNDVITINYIMDLSKEYLFYGYTDNTNYKHLEEIKPITINSFKNPHKDCQFIKLVIVGTYIDDKLSVSKEKLFQVFCGGVLALKHKYEQLKNQYFTGKHRCVTNNDYVRSFVNKFIGQIVISIGKHNTKNINSEKNKDHITIDNSLPIVELSNKINQKNVLGVIAGIHNERIIVNSIGEGAIWICNTNGNLENGDYITTSNIIGYGHKQDDDLLHNYTVSKITLDCNFDLYTDEYKCEEFIDKAEAYIRAFVPCIYFCG